MQLEMHDRQIRVHIPGVVLATWLFGIPSQTVWPVATLSRRSRGNGGRGRGRAGLDAAKAEASSAKGKGRARSRGRRGRACRATEHEGDADEVALGEAMALESVPGQMDDESEGAAEEHVDADDEGMGAMPLGVLGEDCSIREFTT